MQGVKRTHDLRLMLTERQFQRWEKTASDFDWTVSEFARNCIDAWIYAKETQEAQGKTVMLQGRISHPRND